jgi:hypothetical protein
VKSNTSAACVDAVAPDGLVATAVITVVPPWIGTVVVNLPCASGVTLVVEVVCVLSVVVAAIATELPGAVEPDTLTGLAATAD